ncbi:MAG TPA: phospholipase D-like domain-containing protein [Chitinophagaceae bacterium]|nr:phospholipase D-like domain-containing protein [Chitinophagaceae bacterium]
MAGFSRNNSIKLLHAGREFFELLEKLIADARHSIHLHTYIFGNDETGNMVAHQLIEAAGRGVKIYMLVDGYASSSLPSNFIKSLTDAGIEFRFFKPLFKSHTLYFGRRLHHKVIVVDGINALVGGINIADRYNDTPDEPAWLDLAVYVYGDAAKELYTLCCRLWTRRRSRRFALPDTLPPKAAYIETRNNCQVRVRRNDWVKRKQEIFKTYLEIFRSSKKNITILCSYFMPGTSFRKALERAARRGVCIRVVLTGQSDVPISKYAERYLYRWMLRNKIQIYEYKPCVVHAKMAIADEQLLTIGSFNINNISAYASIELNLDINEPAFSKQVHEELEGIISKECDVIDSNTYKTKLYSFRQLFQWGAFQCIRFMLTVSTFYFRQKE